MQQHVIQLVCENCGKQSDVDVSEVQPRKRAQFICQGCGQANIFRVPASAGKTERRRAKGEVSENQAFEKNRYWFGLTPKFLSFVLLPMIIISGVSIFFSIQKMTEFQDLTLAKSSEIVKNVSEDLLQQISDTTARQTRQYLYSHPDLKKADFNSNIYFKKVAMQNFGVTGHTALYERGGEAGSWRYWIHPDAKLVGRDLKNLEPVVGDTFKDFWRVLTGVTGGSVSSGFFKYPDAKGNLQETFMVCTPVEGTPYAISASIFVDEITSPLKKMDAMGTRLSIEMRNANMAIMGIGLLGIGLIIFFYGSRLTGRIKTLSETADRISLGDLNRDVQIRSKDEIGGLAEAILRMQASLKFAIERMSKKK